RRVVRPRAGARRAAGPPERRVRARDDRHLPRHPRPDRARPDRGAGSPHLPAGVGEGMGRGPESRTPARERPGNHGEGGGVSRVTVVGGGLAGIAAALDCAEAGATVTLLESRGRLGGAAYSFTRDGIHADNGQHVFLRCCTDYRALLERIGAGDGVTLQDRLEIPVLSPGRRPARLWRSGLPAPLHLAAAMTRYSPLSVRERAGVARAMRALNSVDTDDSEADARPFSEWLAEHGQSEAAIGAVWNLIVRPTLNLEPADASLAQA